MKELWTMWKNTRMVTMTALTAAIFAALLIPFKSIPIIPGITEFRPAQIIATTFPIFFGPAGAWGVAIGNLIGDFFGTLGPGSFFGFFGNFFEGYVIYKIWQALKKEPTIKNSQDLFHYVLAVILSGTTCAMIIAWGLEILGMFPFAVLGTIISLNNTIVPIFLGPPLILLLYPRIKKWDLIWTEVMDPEDISTVKSPALGLALMWIGGLGGLIVGLLISTGIYGAKLAGFGVGRTGPAVILGVLPFVILFLASALAFPSKETNR